MKTALKLPTLALLLAAGAMLPAVAQPTRANAAVAAPAASPLRPGDHIAAVINQELVTAYEVSQRMGRARDEAQRNNQRLPPDAEFRKQVLESLIEERAMLSHARDGGMKVDEPDIDRAVANMAAQNQMTLAQLRAQLAREGLDLARFRANLKDQMLIERVREREVAQRIRITDSEIDEFIEKQRGAAAGEVQYNIAQVLVTVAENASEAVIAERRARADPHPRRRALCDCRQGGVGRRQQGQRWRDWPEAGGSPARRLPRRRAATGQRRRGAHAVAQRRRLPCAQAG
jgi:peptidyl-prolyl cis-trans isomerase SurA